MFSFCICIIDELKAILRIGEFMKLLITGATGFIGSKLVEKLILDGHELVCITRNIDNAKTKLPLPVSFVEWSTINQDAKFLLSDIDGVFHLAGENVGEKRWSKEQKEHILNSRQIVSSNLVELVNTHANNCKFFIGASAIGYYPDSIGSNWIDEETSPDDNFLAQVCVNWEKASELLNNNIRKVTLRIGVVLGNNGGMLKKLLPIYRYGLGGPVGNGKQWMSWIHVDDVVNMFKFAMDNTEVKGTFNAVAPNPIQYNDFNKIMARFTQRPAFFKVPAFILKLVMGDASILALSSQRIKSSKIQSYGFEFHFQTMQSAIRNICEYGIFPPVKSDRFHHYERRVQFVDRPLDEVFVFFKKATNLEKITPPFLNFKVLHQSTKEIEEGTKFKYQLKLHGLPIRWTTIITEWKENQKFVDFQKTGPYQVWYHRHIFIPVKDGTLMVDEVRYRLPMGIFGELFGLAFVKKDVKNIFDYRQKVIGGLL